MPKNDRKELHHKIAIELHSLSSMVKIKADRTLTRDTLNAP